MGVRKKFTLQSFISSVESTKKVQNLEKYKKFSNIYHFMDYFDLYYLFKKNFFTKQS